MNITDILEDLKEFSQSYIRENLIGIYIHGSYAMDSFYYEYSDIDLLIVVKKPLSYITKRQFVEELIKLSKRGPQKGIELSIILEEDVKKMIHPLKFDFHFSNAHIERYEKDEKYMCDKGTDPDLIAHLKVTKERGVVLFGKPIHEIIGEVKELDFINSIMNDLEDIHLNTDLDCTYYLLNLLRFRYYLIEGKIYSKIEGGKKALEEFGGAERVIIENALSCYEPLKYSKKSVDEDKLKSYFDELTVEIENSTLFKISKK
ncbi:aminoglycoside adenylyltransferase domain-containing protein [Fusibacter ferrireducens]|uniref:DUF4111 domain-containing protein n=1 Tax=Fusibacter ferrireducens TaxID=2785058 RepID=A0ABR9ZTH3_9FIRM|nr:aminoglycoside adenylyltransferase domain-containing protein [Fusibacter ferrireducens]MBF4693764.1 DUF4111 domain-containing protein [Fusibacter ferrireducens]